MVMAGIVTITALYLLASEATKHWFFRHEQRRAPGHSATHAP